MHVNVYIYIYVYRFTCKLIKFTHTYKYVYHTTHMCICVSPYICAHTSMKVTRHTYYFSKKNPFGIIFQNRPL